MADYVTTEMSWENMFLRMEIKSSVLGARFMFVKFGDRTYYVPESDTIYEDGKYKLKINISAAAGRGFLPDGTWRLVARVDGSAHEVRAAFDTAYRFQDLSRVFRYADDKAFILTFEPEGGNGECVRGFDTLYDRELDGSIGFIFHSSFMKKDENWRDKAAGPRNMVYKSLNDASSREHAPGKKHVLFMTETKDHIDGNLKAVYDEVMREGLDKDYTISVYARNDVKDGLGVGGLIRLRKLIADQDIIFVDDFVPVFTYLDPPEGARLVQLWHACVGFKSVGYSRFGKEGSPHPVWSCHRKYTDVYVPHEKLRDVYREVFGIEKDAFKVAGSPRLDGFLDEDKIADAKARILGRYPFIEGKRVLLFAPTYRGSGERDAYYDESRLNYKKWAEICRNENSVILIKMHPFIEKKVDIPEEYRDVISDVSDYPDINELYYLTDILITDYSSDYFEFALLRKPILFYGYDLDTYQLLRGVHQDIRENAPGKVCETFDELCEAIKREDFDLEKTKAFADEYGPVLEQHASKEIIEQVFTARAEHKESYPDGPEDWSELPEAELGPGEWQTEKGQKSE
ncbi:MAG: CDP-glycerol glycerophosphotransferase family protein [Eubacterium sp.]|nr:CDP-glycerol glycerophosphotransferase family protein [Eubacterium sp.]